ncbi:MAG: Gfo/Idh/MocA family oxidoreductase [Nitrospinota bacterium]
MSPRERRRQESEPIRAGVVGVGHMGRYHVAAYAELFDVELAGVADIRRDLAREMADRYGTRAFTDYRDLLGRVDVVSVAVPTSRHVPIAREFLEAGVHVLVEKPICQDLEEARELFRLAGERGVALHVGHVERFNGAVQELKKIVQDPILIECRRLGPFVPRVQDDGVVLDLMIHDLDILLNLVEEEVVEVRGAGSSIFGEREDVATAFLRFAGGCVATVTASRATQEKIRTLAITQRGAYIFLDYTSQDIRIHRRASSEHTLTREELKYRQESLIERVFVHRENPLKLELKHLIHEARNGRRPVDVEKELRSLVLAQDILRLIPAGAPASA